jgi:hypothetical protein
VRLCLEKKIFVEVPFGKLEYLTVLGPYFHKVTTKVEYQLPFLGRA